MESVPRECTLVLGFPGQVARSAVARLIASGQALIVLVPSGCEQPRGPGVEVLCGDVGAIDLGLAGADYLSLVRRATKIVSAVSSDLPVVAVDRALIVRAASELAELVRAGAGHSGVVYWSSLLALGDAKGLVSEGSLSVGQRFTSLYEEAFAVAEQIVRRAGRDVLLSVVRTAPLAGSVLHGELEPSSPLARLARRIRMAPPVLDVTFRDQPVRFETAERAAEALIRLSERPLAVTVHVVDQSPLTDRELVEWLALRLGRRVNTEVLGLPILYRLSLPETPAARTILGWPTAFALEEGARHFGQLLDQDPRLALEAFFPTSAVSGAAGAGTAGAGLA